MTKKNSLLKVIGTDISGIVLLILVPILGPLPGPGGIPLLVAGLGLLAINHEWARKWLTYVKKHSESLRDLIFPKNIWIERAWDVVALIIMIVGIWLNFNAEWWLLQGLSIGIMASASTVFMMNRDRISWLDKKIRSGK